MKKIDTYTRYIGSILVLIGGIWASISLSQNYTIWSAVLVGLTAILLVVLVNYTQIKKVIKR